MGQSILNPSVAPKSGRREKRRPVTDRHGRTASGDEVFRVASRGNDARCHRTTKPAGWPSTGGVWAYGTTGFSGTGGLRNDEPASVDGRLVRE